MMEKRPLFCFTLVELLVVISVIAILAALLLPALKSAKDKAVGIRCMSQMKQINPGIVMYTSDNDGFLPIYLRTLVATNAYSSAGGLPDVLLEPYLKQAQRGSELNTDYFGRIKHIRFRNFYTCPAVTSIHDTAKTIEYTGRVRVFSNYSWTIFLFSRKILSTSNWRIFRVSKGGAFSLPEKFSGRNWNFILPQKRV